MARVKINWVDGPRMHVTVVIDADALERAGRHDVLTPDHVVEVREGAGRLRKGRVVARERHFHQTLNVVYPSLLAAAVEQTKADLAAAAPGSDAAAQLADGLAQLEQAGGIPAEDEESFKAALVEYAADMEDKLLRPPAPPEPAVPAAVAHLVGAEIEV